MPSLPEILWPLVAAGVALLTWNAVCRWLERGSVEFQRLADKHDKLVKEHAETLLDWRGKFELLEARLDRGDAKLDNALKNFTGAGGRNPLGSHYNVRG